MKFYCVQKSPGEELNINLSLVRRYRYFTDPNRDYLTALREERKGLEKKIEKAKTKRERQSCDLALHKNQMEIDAIGNLITPSLELIYGPSDRVVIKTTSACKCVLNELKKIK